MHFRVSFRSKKTCKCTFLLLQANHKQHICVAQTHVELAWQCLTDTNSWKRHYAHHHQASEHDEHINMGRPCDPPSVVHHAVQQQHLCKTSSMLLLVALFACHNNQSCTNNMCKATKFGIMISHWYLYSLPFGSAV